jgi:hypothetical protein
VRDQDAVVLQGRADVVRIGEQLRDFSDTAAVIASLDAVVVADTAVAHLAGAMAKPVFLLLPFAADFRWLRQRADSPWYPTARLYRQPRFGDWDSVIRTLRRDLLDEFLPVRVPGTRGSPARTETAVGDARRDQCGAWASRICC